jgi:hypothetical protein
MDMEGVEGRREAGQREAERERDESMRNMLMW